jgi:hypothetical protein
MFILINSKAQWREYYKGMMCGVIVEVSPEFEEAVTFDTEQAALKERDTNHAFLKDFKVMRVNG